MNYDPDVVALLVWNGCTISDGKFAALGRVGREFVMRDVHGWRNVLPVDGATLEALTSAWRLFRELAAHGGARDLRSHGASGSRCYSR